jgi:predicted nuclease of predicted toxin-antitoxin system
MVSTLRRIWLVVRIAELYLDEDVDVLVADLLRARGFVATTTRDAGKLQASDTEQMACAVSRQETLLTHNRADKAEENRCPSKVGVR